MHTVVRTDSQIPTGMYLLLRDTGLEFPELIEGRFDLEEFKHRDPSVTVQLVGDTVVYTAPTFTILAYPKRAGHEAQDGDYAPWSLNNTDTKGD